MDVERYAMWSFEFAVEKVKATEYTGVRNR